MLSVEKGNTISEHNFHENTTIDIPSSESQSSCADSQCWTDLDSNDSDVFTFDTSRANLGKQNNLVWEHVDKNGSKIDVNGPEMRQLYNQFRKENKLSCGNDFQFNDYMENMMMDWEMRKAGGDAVDTFAKTLGQDSDNCSLNDYEGSDYKPSCSDGSSISSEEDESPTWVNRFVTCVNSFVKFMRLPFHRTLLKSQEER